MSRASKITLGCSIAFALTSVVGVHYIQELERDTLHQGPIKDAERLAKRKKRLENEQEHQLQLELQKKYKELQPLSGDVQISGTDDIKGSEKKVT
ncbi:hypothetical protein ACO0QE_004517 [Hanseniaspora vineae]